MGGSHTKPSAGCASLHIGTPNISQRRLHPQAPASLQCLIMLNTRRAFVRNGLSMRIPGASWADGSGWWCTSTCRNTLCPRQFTLGSQLSGQRGVWLCSLFPSPSGKTKEALTSYPRRPATGLDTSRRELPLGLTGNKL